MKPYQAFLNRDLTQLLKYRHGRQEVFAKNYIENMNSLNEVVRFFESFTT